MRSRTLAERAEKPPRPLPVFHFLKIETPLSQTLQRIRGILYGFLTMFCCLPEEAHSLEHDSLFICFLSIQWLRLPVVVPPDWRHCLVLPTKLAVRLDASLDQVRDVGFARPCFLHTPTSTRVMFANLGPFKAVSELVRFQRLWPFFIDVKDGKLC